MMNLLDTIAQALKEADPNRRHRRSSRINLQTKSIHQLRKLSRRGSWLTKGKQLLHPGLNAAVVKEYERRHSKKAYLDQIRKREFRNAYHAK